MTSFPAIQKTFNIYIYIAFYAGNHPNWNSFYTSLTVTKRAKKEKMAASVKSGNMLNI